MTTKESGGNRKYRDADEGEQHRAIFGFNTNQEDLYGLIRADDATISRLVILHFRPLAEDFDWKEIKRDLLLMTDAHGIDIGYTLYTDLMNREIPHNWSPCRYYGDDKFELINTLKHKN
jgi:hypothetical protein